MTLKYILRVLLVVGIFFLAVGAAHAQVERVSAEEFSGSDATVIDFEDAEMLPGYQYVPEYGVKFIGVNSQALRINDYNRNGDRTHSGQYSIMNDATFPETSSNVPFEIRFVHSVSAVGFYLGNGVDSGEQAVATITLYGNDGQVLDTSQLFGIDNPVTTFYGVKSTEPIQMVSIDYGASMLSEDIDDLMFISEVQFDNMDRIVNDAEPITVAVSADPAQTLRRERDLARIGCTDTDGTFAYQYGTQGVAAGLMTDGGVVQKYVDTCVDTTRVVEYFCGMNGLVIKEPTGYDCAVEGKVCRQGACVATKPSVIPTQQLVSNGNSVDSKNRGMVGSISQATSTASTFDGAGSDGKYLIPPGDRAGLERHVTTVSCDSGCTVEGKCIPVGTRLEQKDGNVYCSWTGIATVQKELNAACQNSYECGTNQCVNSKCVDMEKQLAETQSMIEQFKLWLVSVWS